MGSSTRSLGDDIGGNRQEHTREDRQLLTLRAARPDDEKRLLSWRNDPGTRAASFESAEITATEHHDWFTRKLEDPDCALLIVEEADRPIGQVRLELVTPELAEISIGLAPEARGRGLGREALRLATADASNLLGVQTIKALVKRENEASLRAFRAVGFRVAGEDDDVIELWAGAEGPR